MKNILYIIGVNIPLMILLFIMFKIPADNFNEHHDTHLPVWKYATTVSVEQYKLDWNNITP